MNLRVIFVFLLLVMLTTETHAWWRRRRRRSSVTPPYGSGSGSSQAGGPVTCKHYRGSNTLTCTKGTLSQTCTTQPPWQTDDTRQKGPTPLGKYLIGKRRANSNYNNIDWYNLYPKKEDGSGYYGYYTPNRNGRDKMGLHPGLVSEGCVTVKVPYGTPRSEYNNYNCWQKMRQVIDSGDMSYNHSKYSGYLYVRY